MDLEEIVREIEAPAPVEVPKEVPVETPEREEVEV